MNQAVPHDEAGATRQYWLFEIGTGRCVLAADMVGLHIENAVVRALPDAGPRFDAAVLHDSTQLVPAIDLRERHTADVGGTDVLVLRQPRHVGLIVDRVIGSVSLMPRQIHALNPTQAEQLPDYVTGVTFMEGEPVAVLDPNRLVAEDELPDKDSVSRRLDRRKTPRTPVLAADSASAADGAAAASAASTTSDSAPLGAPSGN